VLNVQERFSFFLNLSPLLPSHDILRRYRLATLFRYVIRGAGTRPEGANLHPQSPVPSLDRFARKDGTGARRKRLLGLSFDDI
jgi:hypothetical protein